MKDIDVPFRQHLQKDLTSLITCWKIVRPDGVEKTFTDHDTDVNVYGVKYLATGAYKRTAMVTTESLSVDNLDIEGISNTLTLPREDLYSGVYDNSEVYIFAVDWREPWRGMLKLRRGTFGQVRVLPNGTFAVELRGIMQRLAHQFTDVFSPTCILDLGSPKCGIPISPVEILRSTAYSIGDVVLVKNPSIPSGRAITLDIKDSNFELSTSLNTSLYWYTASGSDMSIAERSAAANAGNVLGGGTSSGTAAQDISVLEYDFPASDIDSGNIYISIYADRYGSADTGIFTVIALDEDMSSISTLYTNSSTVTTKTVVGTSNVQLPANTRYIRVQFSVSGGTGAQYIDSIRGWVIDTTQENDLTFPYDNVYFVCTTSGTTASSTPSYSFTTGNTTTDGTAVFTCRYSWKQTAIVTGASNLRNFTVSGIDDTRAVTAWFDGGLVTFESGSNKGLSMEVKTWNSSNGTIELFLSMPFPIMAGDIVNVYPGCDKSRASCSFIFDNIRNMRAVPDTPGQDILYRYPDAKE